MSKTHALGAVVLFAASAAWSQPAAPPPSAALKSYTHAREVLDRALAAGGGAALQAVKDVTRTGSGTAYNQGQSLRPSDPYSTRAVEVTQVADFDKGRSVNEQVTTPIGGLSTKTRAVLRGDSGFGHNLLTNVVTPTTPEG